MILFYDNLIQYSGVTFAPSSQQTNLPASNVANEFRKRVWRTGSATAAEYLVMDLGSAKAVSSLILLDHTLTAGDTSIKIQGNSSDSWGAPAFEQTLTWAAGTIAATFSAQTYRYWRLIFTKSAANQTRDIGVVFLGPRYELEEPPDYSGYDETLNDNSKKIKSIGGQTYTDLLDQYGELKLAFSDVRQDMAANLKTFVDYVGQHKSFFLQVETSAPLNKYWYMKLDDAWGRKVSAVDASYSWDIKGMKFEEQL